MREIRCQTVLHRLDYDSGEEYTANFYRGCCHGCVYCYVPSLIHDERPWGAFVDVKVNAPQVLEKELRHAQKEVVFLSSATDPYQAPEARYQITRRCLLLLLKQEFPVSILTRSPLVLRDLDLLKRFDWLRVGFSISTVSDRLHEPGVPPLERRIDCLKKLTSAGIKTWVSLAPVIPRLTRMADLERLIGRLAEAGVSHVSVGLLRFQTYEESRLMFERAIRGPAEVLMQDSGATLERVRQIVRDHSLDRPGELFQRQVHESLDRFVLRA